MKRIIFLTLGTIFLFQVISIGQVIAQDVDISGTWNGAIEVPGMTLEITVDFEKDGEEWKGDMDIPLQKSKDMPLTEVKLQGRKLSFKLPDAPGNANFSGEVAASGEKISGDFNQMGQVFPLNLQQESAAEKEAEAQRLAAAETKFRTLAEAMHEKRHVAGYGIGIVHHGEVLLSEGFGVRDQETKSKVDDKTMFAIGSSSKAFTAMSLALLADEGKLDWDEPIRTYLPDFKMYDDFATAEMTAMDLLTHRSGLPRHDFMWYGSPFSREEMFARLRYLEPNESFRAKWQYQNLMFMTAGYLAGKLNGTTWEELVRERIFKPLGMKNSNFSVEKLKTNANAALGYRWEGEKEEHLLMPYRDLSAIGPAGSINSNVVDMLAWLKLNLNQGEFDGEKIISKSELAQMHAPQMVMGVPARGKETTAPAYGMGWMVYNYKGHAVAEHGGNIDGFTAQVWMMPDDEFGVVVLSNANGSAVPSLLCRYASDLFLDLEETDWEKLAYGEDKDESDDKTKEDQPKIEKARPIEGTNYSHPLKDYAGTYNHPGYGKIVISIRDKMLAAVYNGLEFDLSHWHYDVFAGRVEAIDFDLKFAFTGNVAGGIDKLSLPLEASTDNIVFEKMADARLSDPAWMKQLVGTYDMKVIKAEVELTPGNKLMVIAKGQNPVELVPWRNTEYKLDGLNGYSLEFIEGKKGAYNEVILHQPNGDFPGERTE